jgi:hypothetical protein
MGSNLIHMIVLHSSSHGIWDNKINFSSRIGRKLRTVSCFMSKSNALEIHTASLAAVLYVYMETSYPDKCFADFISPSRQILDWCYKSGHCCYKVFRPVISAVDETSKSCLFHDTPPVVPCKLIDVYDKYIATIFTDEQYAKQETVMK